VTIARATSVKNKRQKLRQPDALIDLGRRHLEEAEIASSVDMPAAALQFRNGLIIALLAYRPMRIANLAAIEIDKHLVSQRDGWSLIFGDGETMQRRRVEFPFPGKLNAALDRYLSKYRPAPASKGAHRGSVGSALWVSQDGGAFTADGIRQEICRLTKDAFGAPINPHLFRDCAATMIAVDDPGRVKIIAAVLGHASMETSERHYNQAQSIESSRQYHQTLAARRRNVMRSREPKRAGR
jgi:integrase/recombinase XerD